jgi:LacI family transcriptional regulator
MTELIHQLELAARTNGLYILLGCSHGSSRGESDVLERFVKAHVDALIVAPGNDHTKATYQHAVASCRRHRKPFVFMASAFDGLHVSSVLANLRSGERAITEYLIRRRHCRFAFVGGTERHYYSEIRYLGLQDAVLSAGLPTDGIDRIVYTGPPTYQIGREAVSEYVSQTEDLPDAFVCVNDLVALGAYRALAEVGIGVPRDVSLVGFDDVPLFVPLEIALTTVRIPVARMARDALEALQGTDGEVSRFVVDTEIVERETVRDRVPSGK